MVERSNTAPAMKSMYDLCASKNEEIAFDSHFGAFAIVCSAALVHSTPMSGPKSPVSLRSQAVMSEVCADAVHASEL